MPKMTFILKDGSRKEVEAPLGLSVLEIAHRLGFAGPPNLVGLLLRATRGLDREAAREQEVAAVPILDFDRVPDSPEVVDGSRQNQLHRSDTFRWASAINAPRR